MTAKIENHLGDKDTFTFPNNPRVYSDKSKKNVDREESATFWDYFITGDSQLKSKRNLVLRGHFYGDNKKSNFRDLHKHIMSNKLKRFYFDEKFIIVMPMGIERTHEGGRTNFIDYVVNLVAPINLLFGGDEKETDLDSTKTNDGNLPTTPIQIEMENLTEGNKYKVEDNEGNGFEFTAEEDGSITIDLVKMISIGGNFYHSWYYEAEYDSGEKEFLSWADPNNDMYLKIYPGDEASSIDATEEGAYFNSNVTIKWYDAYSSD